MEIQDQSGDVQSQFGAISRKNQTKQRHCQARWWRVDDVGAVTATGQQTKNYSSGGKREAETGSRPRRTTRSPPGNHHESACPGPDLDPAESFEQGDLPESSATVFRRTEETFLQNDETDAVTQEMTDHGCCCSRWIHQSSTTGLGFSLFFILASF